MRGKEENKENESSKEKAGERREKQGMRRMGEQEVGVKGKEGRGRRRKERRRRLTSMQAKSRPVTNLQLVSDVFVVVYPGLSICGRHLTNPPPLS